MKKLFLSASILTALFISCTDETTDIVDLQEEATSVNMTMRSESNFGVTEEAPYEVYDPGKGEVYLLIEEGLNNLFSEEAEEGGTDIARGIWYLETGINYLQMDTENTETPYLKEYDDTYITERSLTLNLIDGKLSNIDLREQIIQTYETISNESNNENKFFLLDVQFNNIVNNQISLNLISKYLVNPVYSSTSPWAPPTVASATQNKYAGWKTRNCSSVISGQAAWDEAQVNVKNALPHPVYINRSKFNSNIYAYDTNPYSVGTRKLDGTYLPGQSNALHSHHVFPLNASSCLSIAEQNDYAQAITDQLHALLGKRTYWDGVAWLNVKNSSYGSQYAVWDYYVELATWPTKPNNHNITLPWVTL